jgi:hypothetical protein
MGVGTMIELMSGALVAGYVVAGLFFLRFWRDSKDRLFVLFAAAFWLLAVQRLALVLTRATLEEQSGLYLLRLLAFVLIIVAIVDKNRR